MQVTEAPPRLADPMGAHIEAGSLSFVPNLYQSLDMDFPLGRNLTLVVPFGPRHSWGGRVGDSAGSIPGIHWNEYLHPEGVSGWNSTTDTFK